MSQHTSSRTGNDDYYVTYREFDRAIGDLQLDVSEIKDDVKSLLGAHMEGRGAAATRRVLVTVMLAIVSAGWWLPDLIHKH